jgi:peptidoglycan/LPS O-acetylase OafA/YrhL
MRKVGWSALALVAAAGVLAGMAWFDTTVVAVAQQQARAMFDFGQAMPLWTLGMLAIAGAVLLLALLAWRSRSAVVGVVYLAVGGFFACLPWIVMSLTFSRNDAPPVLPEPIAIALFDFWTATTGPLNAVGVVGAGMAIVGVAVLVRRPRARTITGAPVIAPPAS